MLIKLHSPQSKVTSCILEFNFYFFFDHFPSYEKVYDVVVAVDVDGVGILAKGNTCYTMLA